MVRGVGIDVVEIDRIKNLINKYGNHFCEKVFTPREISYCNEKAFPEIHFSGRWAVKEAFYKALPSFIQPFSTWKSIEIVSETIGEKPEICILSTELKENLHKENISSILHSISHERSICTAIVLIE